MARTDVNWEELQKFYRAGVPSIRELSRMFNVSEGAIRHRAKNQNWPRDLGPETRAEARAKLSRLTGADGASEEEIIEAGADVIVDTIRRHKKIWRKALNVSMELLSWAEGFMQAKKLENKWNEDAAMAVASIVQKVIPQVKTTTDGERRACNLDDDDSVSLDEILEILPEPTRGEFIELVRQKSQAAGASEENRRRGDLHTIR